MNNIKILVVDDHPMVVEGMLAILRQLSYVLSIYSAANAAEGLKCLLEQKIDVVMLDINLPDINGIELCKRITKTFPTVKTIAISTYREKSYVKQMIQQGAVGYLLKTASKEDISQAIVAVLEGNMFISPTLGQPAETQDSALAPMLTKRERQILEMISGGLTNSNIARQLFISELTVDTHRRNLLMKFQVNNTAALIALAAKHNLL